MTFQKLSKQKKINNKLQNANNYYYLDSCKSSLRSISGHSFFSGVVSYMMNNATFEEIGRHGVAVPQQFSSLLGTGQVFIHDFFVTN